MPKMFNYLFDVEIEKKVLKIHFFRGMLHNFNVLINILKSANYVTNYELLLSSDRL